VPEARLGSPEARASGRALFAPNCVLCHGERGDGHGQRSAGFAKAPADFTDPAWRRGATPRRVFFAIREGVHGTPMPSWKWLNETETWDLVAYVAVPRPGLRALSPRPLERRDRPQVVASPAVRAHPGPAPPAVGHALFRRAVPEGQEAHVADADPRRRRLVALQRAGQGVLRVGHPGDDAAEDRDREAADRRAEAAEQGSHDQAQKGGPPGRVSVDEGGEDQPQGSTPPHQEPGEEAGLPLVARANLLDRFVRQAEVARDDLGHRRYCPSSRLPGGEGPCPAWVG